LGLDPDKLTRIIASNESLTAFAILCDVTLQPIPAYVLYRFHLELLWIA
jgi:hypothetical protein